MNQRSTESQVLPLVDARLRALIDTVWSELEARWSVGERPQFQTQLNRFRSEDRFYACSELLSEEVKLRRSQGENPLLDEYLKRLPVEFHERIGEFFSIDGNQPQRSSPVTYFQLLSKWIVPPSSFFRRKRRLGNYILFEELGAGGMGSVHRAQDRHGCVFAVKLLRRDTDLTRFVREMQILEKCHHPNFVQIFDYSQTGPEPYLVMEHIDGFDLNSLVKLCGPLSIPDACEILRQSAIGLGFAHDRGLVHRDVKPANVMLTSQGVAARVKLVDLGLAKDLSGGETKTGEIFGTFDFAAPEQAISARDVTRKADIYSLGCTFYYLLTGRLVYPNEDYPTLVNKIYAHASVPFPDITRIRADLPAVLRESLLRMVEKNPADRFDNMEQIQAILGPLSSSHNLLELLDCSVRENATRQSIQSMDKETKRDVGSTNGPPSNGESVSRRWIMIAGIVLVLGLGGLLLAIRFLSDAPADQQLVQVHTSIKTMPGISGRWWFDETPWFTPLLRKKLADSITSEQGKDFMVAATAADREDAFYRLVQGPRRELLTPAQRNLTASLERLDENSSNLIQSIIDETPISNEAVELHLRALLYHRLAQKLEGDQATAAFQNAESGYRRAIDGYGTDTAMVFLCWSDLGHLYSSWSAQSTLRNETSTWRSKALGAYTSAIELAETEQLKELLVQPGYELAVMFLHCQAAGIERDNREWDLAKDHLVKAEKLGENLGSSHPLLAHVHERYAWHLLKYLDPVAAKRHFELAYRIRETNNQNSEGVDYLAESAALHCQHGLAMADWLNEDLVDARDIFQRLEDELEKHLQKSRISPRRAKSLRRRYWNTLVRRAECEMTLPDGNIEIALLRLDHAHRQIEQGGSTFLLTDRIETFLKRCIARMLNEQHAVALEDLTQAEQLLNAAGANGDEDAETGQRLALLLQIAKMSVQLTDNADGKQAAAELQNLDQLIAKDEYQRHVIDLDDRALILLAVRVIESCGQDALRDYIEKLRSHIPSARAKSTD